MKKPLIAFLAFLILQSFTVANDEIVKTLETLKEQGHISASDLEKTKQETAKFSDQMINDEIKIDPFASFDISKEGILKSLLLLKEKGTISEAEYEKAKKELSTISDAQVKSMTNTAIEIIKKDPDKALDIMNRQKIDFNEVKKQSEIVSPRSK